MNILKLSKIFENFIDKHKSKQHFSKTMVITIGRVKFS